MLVFLSINQWGSRSLTHFCHHFLNNYQTMWHIFYLTPSVSFFLFLKYWYLYNVNQDMVNHFDLISCHGQDSSFSEKIQLDLIFTVRVRIHLCWKILTLTSPHFHCHVRDSPFPEKIYVVLTFSYVQDSPFPEKIYFVLIFSHVQDQSFTEKI